MDMIGPASDTGVGLVARARSCSVAAAISSKPSSGTPTSRSDPATLKILAGLPPRPLPPLPLPSRSFALCLRPLPLQSTPDDLPSFSVKPHGVGQHDGIGVSVGHVEEAADVVRCGSVQSQTANTG